MVEEPESVKPPGEKERDLAFAVNAWVELFGKRLPFDQAELEDELFHASNEKANVVTMAIRAHGYDSFHLALERVVKGFRVVK